LQAIARRNERGLQTAERWKTEKEQFHRAAPIDDTAECVGFALRDDSVGENWNSGGESHRIKLLVGEEIKISRFPVPKMQRDRRASIEHEFRRYLAKLIPQPPLRGRKYLKMRREQFRHERSRDHGSDRFCSG
jgi:hypothetical protein